MADNNQQQKTCSGDCLRCGVQQRMYCSSQHSYNIERMLENLMSRFNGLEDTVSRLDDKVNAMQEDAEVFNPNIAQEGSGAEE